MTNGIHLKTAIRDFVHTLIRPSAPPTGEGGASGLFPDLNDALPTYRNHQEEIDAVVADYRRNEGQ